MSTEQRGLVAHLAGEPPKVAGRWAIADTFAGRVHVEWDAAAPVTPLGQLPFFIDYLKQAGLFERLITVRLRSAVRTHRANAICWAPCCCRCWRVTGEGKGPASRVDGRCAIVGVWPIISRLQALTVGANPSQPKS